jgi:hypothetical protein
MQQGSRSIHKGLITKEYVNATKNYGILTTKDLKDMRELTGHKVADKWAGRPIGGASGPHMLGSHGGFSHSNFELLSNLKRYIYAL